MKMRGGQGFLDLAFGPRSEPILPFGHLPKPFNDFRFGKDMPIRETSSRPQQQILSPAESRDRHQDMSPSFQNALSEPAKQVQLLILRLLIRPICIVHDG
ncbi:hypothetical protein VQ056_12395 [Paenibacillus sp. JTLBN-2024]